jgi:hypothetical protein
MGRAASKVFGPALTFRAAFLAIVVVAPVRGKELRGSANRERVSM